MEIEVLKSESLSKPYDDRYVIVDIDTGEIIDDAQGYGYKSKQNAFAAWRYKTRDKSKDKEKLERYRKIKKWLQKHKDFCDDLEYASLCIAKDSNGAEDLTAKDVRNILGSRNLSIDFTVRDLLYVWNNMNKIK